MPTKTISFWSKKWPSFLTDMRWPLASQSKQPAKPAFLSNFFAEKKPWPIRYYLSNYSLILLRGKSPIHHSKFFPLGSSVIIVPNVPSNSGFLRPYFPLGLEFLFVRGAQGMFSHFLLVQKDRSRFRDDDCMFSIWKKPKGEMQLSKNCTKSCFSLKSATQSETQ